MTNTTLPDEVLKSDVLGRVRTSRARREALLEEFERSGLSGKKFAALVGVKYQTFASWVQARRKTRGQYPAIAKKQVEAVRLVEALVEGNERPECVGAPGLVLELPGGSRLRIESAKQVPLAVELLVLLGQGGGARC